ncbi:MAG: hypothetical protein TREMPRED_003098 [Tremellales sp. Tagirdzhanova-0007]|nr:MAG: hypothetical protein TREMPRED_003098 [Tremellales sp. Tagirdzhanova-0007]
MVAMERMGRIQAEERLKNTEDNLAAAEAAVRDMQLHLQSLPASAVPNLETTMSALHQHHPQRYLSSHVPFSEFTIFLQSLRSLRPLKDKTKELLTPPLITTLLGQPFVARAITEDHDPTLRLDAAPTLSWLTRKGVSQAIVAGDLVIEPVSASTIIANSSSAIDAIGCSLCGKPVFAPTVPQSPASSQFGQPPSHPTQRTTSSSRFSLKPFFNSSSPSQTAAVASPTQSPLASPGPGQSSFTMNSVYVFRVAANQPGDKEPRSYPLCKSGCCLERLRATCQLWYFIRIGIIHVVWQGDDSHPLDPEETHPTPRDRKRSESVEHEATPLPVTRRPGWGLGFKLADKSGSGSWTKAFNRSMPGSPTMEKRSDQVEGANEVVLLDEKSDGLEGLGAPLELDKDTDHAEVEVPMIHEPDPSPTVPTSTRVEAATMLEEGDTVQAPRSQRSDSIASIGGTDDGASFSTPKDTDADLPEENSAENGLLVTSEVPRSDVVHLASPKAATSSGTSAIDISPSKDHLPPPPIPRRAAARDRLGHPDGSGSSSSSLDGHNQIYTPRPAEGESSTETQRNAKLENTRAREEEAAAAAAASSRVEDITDSELEQQAPRPPKLPMRPPLPPRNPRTPTAQLEKPTSDGLKTYLSGDGWDVKTWKNVIRLKEEMWRARVGVIQDRVD